MKTILDIKWCLLTRVTSLTLFSDCSVLRYSACCWHLPVPRPANASPPSPIPTLPPAFERRLASPCASTRVTGHATSSRSSPPSPSQLVSVLVQQYLLQGSHQYQQTGMPNSPPMLQVCVAEIKLDARLWFSSSCTPSSCHCPSYFTVLLCCFQYVLWQRERWKRERWKRERWKTDWEQYWGLTNVL